MFNWHVQDMRALVKYCLQDDPYLCYCLSLIRKMIIENPPYLGKMENVEPKMFETLENYTPFR